MINRHLLLRCWLPLALAAGTWGQRPGAGMGSGTPPGNQSPGGLPAQAGNLPDDATLEQPHAQYVTGKVVLEDGTPPPEAVAIQLVCQSQANTIAYTDSKGHFSADLNDRRNLALSADAAEGLDGLTGGVPQPVNSPALAGTKAGDSMLRQRELMSCKVRAHQPGFRSEVIPLAARRSLDDPDVGTISMHRLSNVEGLTISATSALAPKDARKEMEKAHKDVLKQKWPDAQKELEKAVAIYPKYAAAWYELGNAQLAQKDLEGARRSYGQAVQADPKFLVPYGQLAAMALHEKNWQVVADNTDRLLRLDPVDYPQAWLYNAVANFSLHNMDAAEKSAREGLTHDAEHRYPTLNEVLGAVLSSRRDYAGSAQNLREYLRYAPNASDADLVRKQLSELEKVLEPQTGKQ